MKKIVFILSLITILITSCSTIPYGISDMRPISQTSQTRRYDLILTDASTLKNEIMAWVQDYSSKMRTTYTDDEGRSIPDREITENDNSVSFSYLISTRTSGSALVSQFSFSGSYKNTISLYAVVKVTINYSGSNVSVSTVVNGAFSPDIGYFQGSEGLNLTLYKYFSKSRLNDVYNDSIERLFSSFSSKVLPKYVIELNGGDLKKADFNTSYKGQIRSKSDSVGYLLQLGETRDLRIEFINSGDNTHGFGWTVEVRKIENDSLVRRGQFGEFTDSVLTLADLTQGTYLIILNPASAKGAVSTLVPYSISFSIN